MAKKSRDKGKRAELEVVHILETHGYQEARRGQQYCGANGDADVIGLPGYHVEVKHVERLNLHGAVEQSKRDALPGEVPLVVHRRNRTDWLVTMNFEQFLNLMNGGGGD